MNITEEQKKARSDRLLEARKIKSQERIDEATANKQEVIDSQQTEIKELQTQISEKNVLQTSTFLEKGEADGDLQVDLEKLKKELADLKVVLADAGSLPKKIALSRSWDSVGKPFHKDIFRTKKKKKGFELGFIIKAELDDYIANGYTVAKGQDYGEKEGVLKRKRMIGVERTIESANADRGRQRAFNLAQRTSSLQKTKEMSEKIQQLSGNKTELEVNL